MATRHFGLALLLVGVTAAGATAQTRLPQNLWSRGTTIDLFARVGYHFEDHPITPSRSQEVSR